MSPALYCASALHGFFVFSAKNFFSARMPAFVRSHLFWFGQWYFVSTPSGPFAFLWLFEYVNRVSWYATEAAIMGSKSISFALFVTSIQIANRFGMEREIFFWYEIEASGEKI